jgi:hypothetical protein
MTDAELFATGYFSGLALLAAVGLVVGLALLLRIERSLGRWAALMAVPVIALGTAASSLLSGRDLKYAFSNIEAITAGGAGGGTNVLRVLTVVLVGLCAATLISQRFRRTSGYEADGTPVQRGGQTLMLSFLGFYVGNALVNAAFGTEPSFSHNVLYLPFVFGAVYVWRSDSEGRFFCYAKLALLAFMLGSLALAAVKPSLAVQSGYRGWLPGLSIRLWGLGSNPNSIGPLATLLILLEYMQPFQRRWLRYGTWAAAVAVLLLAQSKTAWAALAAVVPLLAWYRVGRAPAGGMRMGFALALVGLLLAGTLAMGFLDLGRIVNKLAASQVGSDLSTLTGRAQIWAAAVQAWQDNLMFGYGPSAWGPLHRAQLGMPFAMSAHNQFLQSLSAAGLVGGVSLLLYLGVMGWLCWHARERTHGVSLALYLLVLLRCMTEAPYVPSTLFNGDVLTHLVLFRLALLGVQPARLPVMTRQTWETAPKTR